VHLSTICPTKYFSLTSFLFSLRAFEGSFTANHNITVLASFGATRELAFVSATNSEEPTFAYFPQPNNSVASFGKNVSLRWKHGLNYIPEEGRQKKDTFVVVVSGLAKDVISEPAVFPLSKTSRKVAAAPSEGLMRTSVAKSVGGNATATSELAPSTCARAAQHPPSDGLPTLRMGNGGIIALLTTWLLSSANEIQSPVPTIDQRQRLMKKTGLSETQLLQSLQFIHERLQKDLSASGPSSRINFTGAGVSGATAARTQQPVSVGNVGGAALLPGPLILGPTEQAEAGPQDDPLAPIPLQQPPALAELVPLPACWICQQPNSDMSLEPCKHSFHANCLNPVLRRSVLIQKRQNPGRQPQLRCPTYGCGCPINNQSQFVKLGR